MAVKNLKMIFWEIFLTLTDNKLIFVNCKSVSVIKGTPSLLLQSKIFWLAVLSSNYLLYDFNATRFLNFEKNFLDIFLLLVPLEMLSHYLDIAISHWLEEDFQWIMDKVFREKLMC